MNIPQIPQTKMVPIGNIRVNPDNPRVIKDKKFKALVKSIKEFPDMLTLRPIVVDESGMILGGNMRYEACVQLKMTEIPVCFASDLTDEQKKEFIAKDNIQHGDWDWDKLKNDWNAEKLTDWGLDIPDWDTTEKPDDIIPEKDPNILVKISFHPATWLGKREEIINITEKMKKTYNCQVKIDE